MTNKQEMIDTTEMLKTIYEEIADKTLSFGCILSDPADQLCRLIYNKWTYIDVQYLTWCDWNIWEYSECEPNKIHNECWYKIIWHQVMIWDVLDWLDKNDLRYVEEEWWCSCCREWVDNEDWIIELREQKRKPMEDQSEECIKYIYDLVTNK